MDLYFHLMTQFSLQYVAASYRKIDILFFVAYVSVPILSAHRDDELIYCRGGKCILLDTRNIYAQFIAKIY